MKLLKEEHGVSHGYANQNRLEGCALVICGGAGRKPPSTKMYAGPKAGLRQSTMR